VRPGLGFEQLSQLVLRMLANKLTAMILIGFTASSDLGTA